MPISQKFWTFWMAQHRVVLHGSDFLGVVCTPAGTTPAVATVPELDASLLMDGYIVDDASASPDMPGAASGLLRRVNASGDFEAALRGCIAGSFNLAFADGRARGFVVASERIGSIPLYYASVADGFVFSTNPLAILATGLVNSELDWTACAPWIYLGYPVGDRHIPRDLRLFPSHLVLRWSGGRGRIIHLGDDPVMQLPGRDDFPTDVMAALVRRACGRVSKISGPLAHLQSAGMDSRLILASLPEPDAPPCFTYRRPDSTDLPIAEQVTKTRKATFHHTWPDGDVVANALDPMFRANGLMVYPDRYLIAQQISREGFRAVTDGRGGGSLLGGEYFRSDRQHG